VRFRPLDLGGLERVLGELGIPAGITYRPCAVLEAGYAPVGGPGPWS
jgi:hypothetical protein